MGRLSNYDKRRIEKMNALNDIVKEYSETTLDDPEGNGSFLDIVDINNLRDVISACTLLPNSKYKNTAIRKIGNVCKFNYDYKNKNLFIFLRGTSKTNKVMGKITVDFSLGDK